MTDPPDKDALAARAWALMFDFLVSTNPARSITLGRMGLTPNEARALWVLSTEAGRPIGSLARDWACDPSNVTFIVDRLEQAGLAERRSDPDDRRVKLVYLTPKGARTQAQLLAEYRRPPAEMLELEPEELRTLEKILGKLSVHK